jgi:hypothetical protein
MKRSILILMLGLLAGLAAFAGLYSWKTVPHQKAVQESAAPELAWLRTEFNLSDEDFVRISELHLGYLPECEEMCRRIEAVHAKLRPLVLDSTAVTPQIEGLLAEAADLRRHCQSVMLQHFYAVSRAMPEAEGRRYLARMQELTLSSGTFHHPRHGH